MNLSRYEIVKPLAEGGFGQVYLARILGEAGFHRTVAIKRIKPELTASQEFVNDFIKEARIGGYLQHHNVVQVLGFERIGGQYALVMEYVDGVGLERVLTLHRVQQNFVHPALVAEFMAQAAEGLHYVHALKGPDGVDLKLVHRDLKPSNLLISDAGLVKVSDFGIARAAVQLGQQKTQAGLIKGTVAYFSPEQARGEEMDCRSDLYSMGSILYEMLALQALFPDAQPYAVLGKVGRNEVDERLAQLPAGSEPFLKVLRGLLTSQPNDRIESAAVLATELRQLQHSLAESGQSLQQVAGDWSSLIRNAKGTDAEAEQTALMQASSGDPWLESMQLNPPSGYGEAPTVADPNLLNDPAFMATSALDGPTQNLEVPLPPEATPVAMRGPAAPPVSGDTRVLSTSERQSHPPKTSSSLVPEESVEPENKKSRMWVLGLAAVVLAGIAFWTLKNDPAAQDQGANVQVVDSRKAGAGAGASIVGKTSHTDPNVVANIPKASSENTTNPIVAIEGNPPAKAQSSGTSGAPKPSLTVASPKSPVRKAPRKRPASANPVKVQKSTESKKAVSRDGASGQLKKPAEVVTQPKVQEKVVASLPVAAPGFASITSLPSARIFVDGKDRGETPLRKLELSAGKHSIRLSRPDLGYRQELSVTVKTSTEVRVICSDSGCDVTYP